MLWGIGLKFCFTNKETLEGCESSIKLTLTADISSYCRAPGQVEGPSHGLIHVIYFLSILESKDSFEILRT